MAHEKAISEGFDALWGKSLERNWIPGRLGLAGGFPIYDVPDRPGYKYVNKGIEGEQGQVIALDKVGVQDVFNQRVRMRREFGEYVIREAEYLDSAGGLSNTLAGLTDVAITSVADGDIIVYDSGLGEWVNAAAGGGGGSTYYAGDAIDIDGGNVISVQVNSSSGIVVDTGSNTLMVNTGDGLKITTNLLTLNLAANPGLEYSTGQVRVKAGDGIAVGASGVALDFATDPGLEISSGNVRVKEYFGIERSSNGIGVRLKTTSGLVVDIAGVAVGAGDGIDVLTSTIAVDVTDIIDTAAGIKEDASNNIQVRLETNSGLQFGGAGGVQLGTPTTLTVATVTNTVTTTTHQHAITSSSDVGTSPVASILASNSSGQLTLAQLTLRGNLVFAGGDRSITASNTLTIAPTTDLVLDPTGLVLLPNAQELRTSSFTDAPTGIVGMRMWDRGSNYRQLTTGAIKADELYVRVFVADEVRIDRGEELWSKSYGVVETDFTMPADEATVDVWFENSPGLAAANIFSVNDWLLARTIDWDTSLSVEKIWFQVVSLLTAGSVDGYRQQWRIRRKSGGTTSTNVKKGNVLLDAGVAGQGVIYLSALEQDGGPFIKIGEFVSVASDTPQFTYYAVQGNLNGTVDYAVDTYGQAAGDDIGTAPSAGFSGYSVDATNGLRLFNTDIALYDSGVKMVRFDKDTGLTFDIDVSEGATFGRYVRWQDDVDSLDVESNVRVGAFKETGGANKLGILVVSPDVATNAFFGVFVNRSSDSAFASLDLDLTDLNLAFALNNGLFNFANTGRFLVSNGTTVTTAASKIHSYENTTATDATAGITIEQDSTGDSLLQFYLTSARRWVVGIDNSDSDKFKISNNAALGAGDVLTIDTSGNVGISTATPRSILDVADGSISFDSNGTANANIILGNTSSTWLFRSRTDAIVLQAGLNDANPRTVHIRSGDTNYGLYVNTNGRVFVGTTGTPGSPLHVYESTTATTTAAGVTIEQGSTGDAKVQFLLTGGQRWGVGIDNSASDAFVIASGTDLSSSPSLTITTGGITGTGGHLGVGTTAPGVDVISTTDITAGKMVHIDGDTSTAKLVLSADISASISLIGRSGSANEKWLQIVTSGGSSNITSLNDTGANPTTFFTMDHGTGYVGINNSTPDARLDVETDDNNGIRSVVYGSTNWFNYVSRRALGTQASPTRALLDTIIGSWGGQGYTLSGWGAAASAQIQMRAAENYTATANGSKIEFYTTLDGTTTITKNFSVENDGGIYAPYIWATAVNGTAVQINSNGVLTKATSSIRFKTNVREMPGAFGDDFVMALRPIVYNNRHGDDANDYVGFVAEDVFGIGGKPFVSFNDAGLVESLHYDKLTVPLVAAVQDLIPYKARIAQLEAEMTELKARVYAIQGE